MPPTPQYALAAARASALGTEVWVKHENHTPTGAFKVRGGLDLLRALAREQPRPPASSAPRAATTASRSASRRARTGCGPPSSCRTATRVEKNAAMRALGVDADRARRRLPGGARARGAARRRARPALVPSFHRDWCAASRPTGGVLRAAARGRPTCVYVPIGLGSGVCGRGRRAGALRRDDADRRRRVGARDRLPRFVPRRPRGRIAGHHAAGRRHGLPRAVPRRWQVLRREATTWSRSTTRRSPRRCALLFTDTHNVAEGAGAAALAGAIQQRERWAGSAWASR